MQKFTLKCFGVGDGFPSADRNHSAFLYRLGKTSILIDCGEPISRNYKASGLSYNLVDSIFLSHLHSDHAGGLFMLMQGFWLERRSKRLPLYAPGGAIKPLRDMLNAAMIFDQLLPFPLELRGLRASEPLSVGRARVTPFATSHLERLEAMFGSVHRQEFAAYAFLIEHGRRRIGHSADLGKPEDLEPLLARPLDLLVCELAHFTPQEIFSYLKGRPIKHVVFVHVARELWANLAPTRRLAARLLRDIPHTFARDLQEIAF